MNSRTKKFIYCFSFALTLSAALIFGCSCQTSKTSPLVGWQIEFKPVSPSVEKDAQDYMQKLPPEEKKYAGWGYYYKDATGQHAIVIQVALDGTWWNHVLIYDVNNKRIKVVKYSPGHYGS